MAKSAPEYRAGSLLEGGARPEEAAYKVKIFCKDGHPVVFPKHLPVNTHERKPTLIQWWADTTVAEIQSIRFKAPQLQFTQPEPVTPWLWMCLDLCQIDDEFEYEIMVRCVGAEEGELADPFINNEDGGP